MLNVTKEAKGNVLVASLVGVIDETTDFSKLIGDSLPKELHLNCKGVTRINSMGTRGWVKYFEAVSARGTLVTLKDCSPAIVEQLNLIVNFAPKGEVESVCVPFYCNSCSSQLIASFRTADLKKSQLNVPSLKCPKCPQGTAVFDDVPSEYFAFIARQK